MNSFSLHLCRAVALAAALPMIGLSTSFKVNSNCEFGACPAPNSDSITVDGVSSGTINFVFTTADGDEYKITGNYDNEYVTATHAGTFLEFTPTITYIGNDGNAVKSVGKNTITVTMYQNFYDTEASPWDSSGTTPPSPFCEDLTDVSSATGVTATGEVSFDGNSVGLLNLTNHGTVSQCTDLYFTKAQNKSNYLDTQFVYTATFDKGDPVGTLFSSPATLTPEPATVIPMGVSLAGFGLYALRRRKAAR